MDMTMDTDCNANISSSYYDDESDQWPTSYVEFHTSLHDPFNTSASSCEESVSETAFQLLGGGGGGGGGRRYNDRWRSRRNAMTCGDFSPDAVFGPSFRVEYSSPIALRLSRQTNSSNTMSTSFLDKAMIEDTSIQNYMNITRSECEGQSSPNQTLNLPSSKIDQSKRGQTFKLHSRRIAKYKYLIPKEKKIFPEAAKSKSRRNAIRNCLKSFSTKSLETLAVF